MNLLEIKPLLRDYVVEHLPEDFKTVFWAGNRYKAPLKPYCMLSVLSDTTDAPTSENQLDNSLTKQTTIYKNATITVAVYVDGVRKLDERDKFAYKSINDLRTQFETLQFHYKFKHKFSVLNLTGIRPLCEPADGGYLYRYEFDMTIGFNEVYEYDLPISKAVNIDINEVHLEITEDNIEND